MARPHGGTRQPRIKIKPALEPIITIVVEECYRVSNLPLAEQMAEKGPGSPFPPIIPFGMGQIHTSNKGFEAIGQLTELYAFEPPSLRNTISKNIYSKAVLFALGEAMLDVSNQNHASGIDWARIVAALFEQKLAARLANATKNQTQYIPCHIFHPDQKAPSFQIGPVTFLPRPDWLKTLDAVKVDVGVIRKAWNGSISNDDLQKQAFGPGSTDAARGAFAAVKSISNHYWVAAIKVPDHEPIQSAKKGTMLVSLAMDVLSLLLTPTDSARLVVSGMQRTAFSERNLFSNDQGKLFDRVHINMHGIGGPPGHAQKFLKETKPLREAAGLILSRYDADAAAGRSSKLVERWINALYWYGQALREPSDFLAIVKYGCAMDILTDGEGNLPKLASRVAVAFGIKPDTKVTKDGETLTTIISRVFNEGRSALAHGSDFGVLAEKANERAVAYDLVYKLLLAFVEPLASVIKQNNAMLTLKKDEMKAFEVRLAAFTAAQQTSAKTRKAKPQT